MKLFSNMSEAKERVSATTRRTMVNMPYRMAEVISQALSCAPEDEHQRWMENKALTAVLLSEDKGHLRMDRLMLLLLQSVAYRAIREEQARAETAGYPRITAETLKEARLYEAGKIAGYAAAHREFAKRERPAREGQPADARDE